jgi:hypothetical protein
MMDKFVVLQPFVSEAVLQPFASQEELPIDHDEKVLLSLGYKQEFKREFSLWTSFCVSFAVLGLLPSIASTLFYGMGYAGTAGMFLIPFPGFSPSNHDVDGYCGILS